MLVDYNKKLKVTMIAAHQLGKHRSSKGKQNKYMYKRKVIQSQVTTNQN